MSVGKKLLQLGKVDLGPVGCFVLVQPALCWDRDRLFSDAKVGQPTRILPTLNHSLERLPSKKGGIAIPIRAAHEFQLPLIEKGQELRFRKRSEQILKRRS